MSLISYLYPRSSNDSAFPFLLAPKLMTLLVWWPTFVIESVLDFYSIMSCPQIRLTFAANMWLFWCLHVWTGLLQCVCVWHQHACTASFWLSGVFLSDSVAVHVSRPAPPVVLYVWFSPHFNIPVPLYCFSIVWMTSVFCYRWTSACLWTVLIRLVLHVLACQHVNVCLHDHGLPTS